MDAKLIEPRSNVPFSNSMEADNLPSNTDGPTMGGDDKPAVDRPNYPTSGGTPVQTVNYPLPPDPHAP